MAHVIIGYSVPVYNRGELLDGTLSNEILCYQNFMVDIQTNVPFNQLGSNPAIPTGYYITSEPTITASPPKTGLYERVFRSTCFSKTALNASITRTGGSRAGLRNNS